MSRIKKGFELLMEDACVKKENGDVKCYEDKKSSLNRMTSSTDIFEPECEKDILDVVGGNGPWQRRILLIMLIAIIPGATHNFSMTFLAPELDHWCAKPSDLENVTLEQWRLDWLPPGDKKKCYRFENRTFEPTLNENVSAENIYKIVACDSWDYDNSFYPSTVLDKWNLVCDRDWLVSLTRSVFMSGILVGVSVFGCVSDKLGRRPTISICSFLMVFFAFVCAFSVSFTMFIITRFMIAAGIGGYYTTFFVLLMEVSSSKVRPVYGLAVQFGWCIGYVCLPGIAWLVRDWFWLQIAITVPCIGLFGIWWIIPESPRWLLAQGRVYEAREILRMAAKMNNVDLVNLDPTLDKLMEQATKAHEAGETEGNILDLLITPGLWKITLNVYLLWFVNAFVYFGLSYNTNELEGDPFLMFALSGAVEFPAYFLSIFAMQYMGRRVPIAATMITAGTACVLAYLLPQDLGWATVLVSMIGKFCITSSLGMVYVFTTELFPTVVRNAGLGSAALCEGIASIFAPFTKELGDATHPVIPLVLIGFLSLGSGVLALLLPETHHCVVPDTLKEAANASRRKNGKKTYFPKHIQNKEKSAGYVGIPLQETDQSIDYISPLSDATGLPCYEENLIFKQSFSQ